MVARALYARGDHAGALLAWRKAAIESPDDVAAWSVIAIALADSGKAWTALLPAGIAVALRPAEADNHARLAVIRVFAGALPGAMRAFRRAIALGPGNAVVLGRFGHVAGQAGQPDLGAAVLTRALAVDPTDGAAWAAVAQRRLAEFSFDAAERALMRGLAAAPSQPMLLAPMAEFRRDQGGISPALRLYDRAIAVDPSMRNERAYLLALLYEPAVTDEARLGRHLAYARRHAPDRPRPPARTLRAKRIHVAYLSAGFFDHPTAAVVVRLLEAHDRNAFEVSLFAHVRTPDAMSRRLQAASDRWVDVLGQRPEEISDAIRASGADILVVLAGRYDPVAWPVAALRPAPVQVAFHDTATSGMAALDHLIVDAVLSPRDGPAEAVEIGRAHV